MFHCVRNEDVRKEWKTAVWGTLLGLTTRSTTGSAESTTGTRTRRSQTTEIPLRRNEAREDGVFREITDFPQPETDLVMEDHQV